MALVVHVQNVKKDPGSFYFSSAILRVTSSIVWLQDGSHNTSHVIEVQGKKKVKRGKGSTN